MRKMTHDDEPPEWTAEEWDYYAWTSPYMCEHALTGATFCSGVGAAELAARRKRLCVCVCVFVLNASAARVECSASETKH